MLAHPQLVENQKGFFVHKVVPDFTNQNCFLLDMSPQDNVSYYRTQQSDLRDVVLKPGIIYENTDVKFENVVDNKDGTFSIDITIKATKDLTLEPVLLDAANNGTNIVLTWDNRCTDCESDNYYIIEYREVGTSSWSESISNAVLTSESYTLSGIDMTKDYQFRGYIFNNGNRYISLYSNIVSTNGDISNPTTAITVNSADDKTSVFPNPSTGQFKINSKTVYTKYNLKTLDGRTVETGEINSNNLNLEHIKSGSYIVELVSGQYSIIHKITIF